MTEQPTEQCVQTFLRVVNRRAGRSRRTGLGLADAAERETAERRQRAGGDAGALQESTAVQITAGLRSLSTRQSFH